MTSPQNPPGRKKIIRRPSKPSTTAGHWIAQAREVAPLRPGN
ncbi:hypothetical protein OG239_00285 [Streptomyces sp. NBC_00868]|nr:hypothetical protein OG239_00285 [Streptomyces sp. NBC_00868]